MLILKIIAAKVHHPQLLLSLADDCKQNPEVQGEKHWLDRRKSGPFREFAGVQDVSIFKCQPQLPCTVSEI